MIHQLRSKRAPWRYVEPRLQFEHELKGAVQQISQQIQQLQQDIDRLRLHVEVLEAHDAKRGSQRR